MSQIIKDFAHPVEVFGLQSVGDYRILKILNSCFRMIPMFEQNVLGRSRIEGRQCDQFEGLKNASSNLGRESGTTDDR